MSFASRTAKICSCTVVWVSWLYRKDVPLTLHLIGYQKMSITSAVSVLFLLSPHINFKSAPHELCAVDCCDRRLCLLLCPKDCSALPLFGDIHKLATYTGFFLYVRFQLPVYLL